MFYEKIADNEGYLNITRRRGNRNTRGDLMPHFHNSIEFYLCVKGEYLVYINGERHLLHAGEIAFVDRFTIHDACFIGAEEETEVYFIIASSAYLTGLQWLADETLPPFTGRKEGFERIISFVSMAYSMRDEMDEDMMRGFVTLLLGMMRNHCGSLPRVTEKGTQVLIDVMKHIDENLSERITLDSLSRIYGYEKTYFSRKR